MTDKEGHDAFAMFVWGVVALGVLCVVAGLVAMALIVADVMGVLP